jgi:hypothetical protein
MSAAWIIVPSSLVFLALSNGASAEDGPDFNRDVRPILASKCFACHGPDEEAREADLRLDMREVAVEAAAIVPGDADGSELLRRVESDDEFERMPPPDAGEPLTADERRTLREWIAAGAKYEPHWAFVPPRRPAVPDHAGTEFADWPRNPIDAFVMRRLLEAGLEPSPEADRYALARRVHLDLIGLPPTPEEADAFVQDDDPLAYEKLVERLLASPHYGERWARPWLDLARYSDTNGYEKDRPRSVWPYRDWVIDALNADMPFDRFTVEQLAGDMLPGAAADQKIATGFHRNTMLNEEGGIDPLEFRFYAMIDRVATTGTVWMGLTVGCAQCHTHKYDPISHREFYALMALLNNADEPDLAVPDPDVLSRRRDIEQRIARLESELPERFPPLPGDGPVAERRRKHLEDRFAEWIEQRRANAVRWTVLRPSEMETNLPRLELLDDGSVLSTGDITKRDVFRLTLPLDGIEGPVTALRLEALPDERLPAGGPGRAYYEGRKGDFFLSEVTARRGVEPVRFAAASHSHGKISVGSGTAAAANVIDGDGSTGWSTAGREGEPHQLVLNLAEPLDPGGTLHVELLFERHFAASLGRFRLSATSATGRIEAHDLPVELESILAREPSSWTEGERDRLRRRFLLVAPELADARKPIEALRKSLPELPTTLVMAERPPDNPRPTHRHHRGEFLSPREEVSPGVPAVFPPLPEDERANRLAFARWLVSDRNPLVGRVTVNRDWRAFFGEGLVQSVEDFGTQSDPPTHPDLLDWLAREFIESGWSRKHLHRLIVTSAAYRQRGGGRRGESGEPEKGGGQKAKGRVPDSGSGSPLSALRTPLYARFRVDAETVRDIVLAASGRLSTRIGGPSVFPPQPAGVTALAYGNVKWDASEAPDRYRRSLYTFSKRTAPFAAYAVFDGPTGETCLARRDRSNTPLQALTLLNDEMFLELARALAADAAARLGNSPTDCATAIFRRLLTRPPTEFELNALLDFHASQRQRFEAGELDAAKIARDGSATPRQAAWILVARAVMNLDEVITKP